MNWLDIVILVIVAATAFMGLKIGVIRAGLTALGIFVGSVLGGQLSDDIGGLFNGIDSDSAVATVISYAIIISACLVAAAIASIIIRKAVYMLFMGWIDRLAGLALGTAAGAVIAAAVIMGMASLTYSSEITDSITNAVLDSGVITDGITNKAVESGLISNEIADKVLSTTLDTEKAKKRLADGLTQSTVASVFIEVVDVIPASTLWFVPSNFKSALDVLEQRQGILGS
ncbi:MAG: CvpA family protein [SAR202 cluster bacterium]|nr:CvpA family protein [SAR202 cluster bacterium]